MIPAEPLPLDAEHKSVDAERGFVSRKEACDIAVAEGQAPTTPVLVSPSQP